VNKKAAMIAVVMALVWLTGPDRGGRAWAQEPPPPLAPPQPPATTPAGTPAGTKPGGEAITTGNGTLKINFPEMDLESVLRNFSAITGKSFILDAIPKGQVITIGPIGPVEIPRDQALRLFMLIMDLNGFVVVRTSVDGVYKVVKKTEAMKEPTLPLYGPGRAPEATETMVTRFIQLKHLASSDVVAQLNQLSSKDGGTVVAYPALNMLIIMDTAINIERMLNVLRIIDVPSPAPAIEIITLKYSNPAEMAAILGQIFESTTATTASRTASTRATPNRRPAATPPGAPPAAPQPAAPTPPPSPGGGGEGGEIVTKFIPIERLNGLIVIADKSALRQIKEMIAKIDIDAGMAGTIHVYYAQNATAAELAAILSSLGGRGGGATSSTTPTTTRPSPMTSPGMSSTGMNSTGMSSTGLGATGMNSMSPMASSYASSTRARGGVGGTVSLPGILNNDINITSDEATNSLIVVATPQDWSILRTVLVKLDIPRRQVFVEAVLMEITYDEKTSGGTSLHGASPLQDNGVLLAGSNFTTPNSLNVLSSLTSGSALPTGITIGALGRAIAVPGTGGAVTVPSAGIIVQMLSSYSDINVLSTPTLLTTDNTPAQIKVGQKIPVPTGQTVSTGGFANTSISREDVGITLQLTPQINESDNIRMDIYTEISSAIAAPQGIDVNTLGVTTSNKAAQTSVIVKDSQTIVIGGLMQDTTSKSQSWVPLIGDIPLLGWLFKNASEDHNKTNLVILITPHIVKSDVDVAKVKEDIKNGYDTMSRESRGLGEPIWDKYFETQMKTSAPGGTPEEWEFTPGVDSAPRVVNPKDKTAPTETPKVYDGTTVSPRSATTKPKETPP
jgi:general secretion pathway protein D